MKNGWGKTERLGDLFRTAAGGTPSTTKREYYDGGTIPWLMSGEMRQGLIRSAKTYITEQGLNNSNAKVFPKETVVVALYGATAGQVGILDTEAATNQAVFGIYPNGRFAPKFIFYLLLSRYEDLVSQAVGNAQPNLSGLKIKNVPVPKVELTEQRRIVGVLDAAFAGIAAAKASAEQNLQNARALFESHLQTIFTQRGDGWDETQLADVCQRLHQGLNTAGEKVKFYQSGYPIIQTRNIDNGVVELDSKIKFMCEADWQLYKDKYRPEVGDVFFTNIGTIGKTAIVTVDRDYLIHWNIFKLRPLRERITSEFLRYTLERLTLSGYFENLQKGGTVDFVTKKMISEALIYVPSMVEQKNVVATLDVLREATQRLEAIYRRKLAALEELKKSLLDRAFRGEL